MEDLFGVLVVAFVAIASILSKLREGKNRDQGDVEVPDPEEWRKRARQLFEEGTIRTAKPAQPQAEADEGWTPVAPPRHAQPQVRQAQPQAPPSGRPVVTMETPRLPQDVRQPVQQQARPQVPAQGRQVQPRAVTQRPQPQQLQRPAAPPRRQMQPRPVRVAPALVHPEEDEGPKMPLRTHAPQPRQAQHAAAAQQDVGRGRMRSVLFDNLQQVRHGIVLAEILGPPKALQ